MKGNFFQGVWFFWEGIHCVFKPNLRRYITLPIFVNLIIFLLTFVGISWVLYKYFSNWINQYPQWIIVILGWLFWLLYGALSLLICTFAFTIITNIIASPFYGVLAEKVERDQKGDLQHPSFSLMRTLKREFLKLAYFIPWLLVFLVLLLFPPIWFILPFLVFFPLAYFIGTQYIDYCPDNQGVSFKEVRTRLRANFLTILGFGSVVSIAMTLPAANLFVPPAAVAGGCLLWLNMQKK